MTSKPSAEFGALLNPNLNEEKDACRYLMKSTKCGLVLKASKDEI